MVTQPPSSDLNVRLAGRAFAPSRVDADKIKSAMGVVVEVLESLLKLLSDERTMEALTSVSVTLGHRQAASAK